MKKNFYLAAAALLAMTAQNVKAQDYSCIDVDSKIESPWDDGDYAGETGIIISAATVTFTHEAFNTCGLPSGTGSEVILDEGAKVVFYDTPDTWYPDPDGDECSYYADYLYNAEAEVITSSPYNWNILGASTIVLDSKMRFGGIVKGSADLTIVVGDSTIIDLDLDEYTGQLHFEYLNDKAEESASILIGSAFPGDACASCGNGPNKASDNVCWCGLPWSMQVPDNVTLKVYDSNAYTAYPAMYGENISIEQGTGFMFLRPNVDVTYSFGSVTGGSASRNFEIYAAANITLVDPIDYTGNYAYPRNKNFGIWVNSTEPCFKNITYEVSVRNNDGFVGGNGVLDCGIACKDGTTTHIRPGEGFNQVGELTVNRAVYLGTNNALDVDFGANGAADRLTVKNTLNISGEYTRLWIQLLDEFYTNPKAGDYKVIDATDFVSYNKPIYDSTQTYSRYTETQVDSILAKRWPNETDETVLQHYRDSLSALINYVVDHYEVTQNIVWKANLREDGTSLDSLPEGLSWYPLEWNGLYSDSIIALKKDSLIAARFFTKGVITIFSAEHTESSAENIVNGDTGIEDVMAAPSTHGRIISSQLYTLDGRMVASPVKGINIVRNEYEDGTVETKKFIGIGD